MTLRSHGGPGGDGCAGDLAPRAHRFGLLAALGRPGNRMQPVSLGDPRGVSRNAGGADSAVGCGGVAGVPGVLSAEVVLVEKPGVPAVLLGVLLGVFSLRSEEHTSDLQS